MGEKEEEDSPLADDLQTEQPNEKEGRPRQNDLNEMTT